MRNFHEYWKPSEPGSEYLSLAHIQKFSGFFYAPANDADQLAKGSGNSRFFARQVCQTDCLLVLWSGVYGSTPPAR